MVNGIDTNKDIFDAAPDNLLMLKYLDEKGICQYFLDSFDSYSGYKNFFPYFEDHADEFMPTLLSLRTRKEGNTFFNMLLKKIASDRWMFNWILPYIRKMSNNDRLKYLETKNYIGQSTLYFVAAHVQYEKDVETILSLYPNKKSIESGIVSCSYNGETAVYKAMNASRHIIASIFWNRVQGVEAKLMSVNPNALDSPYYGSGKIYNRFVTNLLKSMKSGQYINNVETLMEPFASAATKKNFIPIHSTNSRHKWFLQQAQ